MKSLILIFFKVFITKYDSQKIIRLYWKSYEAPNQITSYQYLFLLAKIRSLIINNLYLLDFNKRDENGLPDKSFIISKLESFYWNNWSKIWKKKLNFHQIGGKSKKYSFTLRSWIKQQSFWVRSYYVLIYIKMVRQSHVKLKFGYLNI